MRRTLLALLSIFLVVVILVPAGVIWLFSGPGDRVRVETGGPNIRLLFHQTGQVKEIPLEEYLVGVVAGEMPAEFHIEALKAQAVASRTYALKRIMQRATAPNPRHPEADVCTDATHCQAWMSRDDMEKRWGVWEYIKLKQRIEKAVADTANLVLTYQGKLAEPVFHANAGGITENSEEVWQIGLPYLRSVSSPWDLQAPRAQTVASFSLHEIDRLLGTSLAAQPVAKLAYPQGEALRLTSKSSTGRAKEIMITGKKFAGTELRRMLGLRSTKFKWEIKGDRIVFTVDGHGHGVGMSQYGANGMAQEGKSFRDILTHYYTGVEFSRYGQ
ncbi:MAG: stage II sporulation protein D [Bacillota bacterium]